MTYKSRLMSKLDAANKLSDYAAELSSYKEMLAFQNKFNDIVHEYNGSPYAILSTGIFLERLDSFKDWLPTLIQNEGKVVPILVSNMLQGDMFAESIYKEICHQTGKADLFLDIYKILNTPSLERLYSENGRSGGAQANINAEHWLLSQEAVKVFEANHHGYEALCYANELLGLHNNFTDCEWL